MQQTSKNQCISTFANHNEEQIWCYSDELYSYRSVAA